MSENLWKHTIALAQKYHQGKTSKKARLRERIWWPNKDKQAGQFAKACHPCQLGCPRSMTEPIEICPGLNANEIQIPYDKHHKLSSLVKSHQNTQKSVKYEVV